MIQAGAHETMADAMIPEPPALPTAAAGSEEELHAAVALAPPFQLAQPWESPPSAAPTTVRVAWCPSALLVRADLEDADVHTAARHDSERFWELGDVFEIFLEAAGTGFYTEMHIAPGNLRLHLKLRHEDFAAIKAGDLDFSQVLVTPPAFQSCCRPLPGGWRAEALIPAEAVHPGTKISSSSDWRASFCRYDAWSDGRKPDLSSTSSHSWPINFHRRSDWRPICF